MFLDVPGIPDTFRKRSWVSGTPVPYATSVGIFPKQNRNSFVAVLDPQQTTFFGQLYV